jgi:arylsulfatase A-like enzyme
VLLFLVDTLRADALGAYGNDVVETPAIERFAREGTLFEQAFAQTPWTRPSVTSIRRFTESRGGGAFCLRR